MTSKYDNVIRDLSKVHEGKKLYNMKAYGQVIPELTVDEAVSIIEDEEVGNATVRGNKIFCNGKQIAVLEAI
jgi:cytochrome c-type biogenesis protein CcmH/NrfG